MCAESRTITLKKIIGILDILWHAFCFWAFLALSSTLDYIFFYRFVLDDGEVVVLPSLGPQVGQGGGINRVKQALLKNVVPKHTQLWSNHF